MQKLLRIKPVFIVVILLALLPFFWSKPGELNIGGDGSSIYFYDPINVIKHIVLYKIFPYGTGPIEVRYFYLPFVSLLAFFKSLFVPSYLLSVLHTSLKLSVGFVAIYAIMKELLSRYKEKINIEIIALLTGLFYIFSPLITQEDRYINPIPSHDQVFLNPLIFYLVLRYFITQRTRYLLFILPITLIFSTSFSYSAAPAIFAFYPLAFLFMTFYVLVILKRALPIKGIIIGIAFFVLLHLFHLGPELANLLDPASDVNTRVFSRQDYKEQVQFFYGVLGFASLPKSILLPSVNGSLWLFFVFLSPLIILLGFLKNRKVKSNTFLLTAFFFLITLFLISAKVLYGSVKLYEFLFSHVPGFGMFRSFYIQWLFAYTFFYTLLFGQALFLIYTSLDKTKVKLISILLFVYLTGSAWGFIRGDQFNIAHAQSDSVRRQVVFEPQYEKMLSFIRGLPYDGKVLQFPFSDFNFQVIHGINDGAYVGTPTIGQLTGVKDFAGYWNMAPYSEAFLQLAKEKDYERLSEIIGLLNIRYIFHNSDPGIYDTSFTGRPFEYTRTLLPATQKQYEEFIKPLVGEKLLESGPYRLYLTDELSYIPHVYIPKKTIVYEYNPKYNRYYHAASSFLIDLESDVEKRAAYVEKNNCPDQSLASVLCNQNMSFDDLPKIFFKKINPIKYIAKVTNAKRPFLLIFSDAFHKDWKLFISPDDLSEKSVIKTYFNGDIEEGVSESIFLNKKTFETLSLPSIPETQHISVNAYANAWYITPEDIDMKNDVVFIIEMTGQRAFYFSSIISILSLVVFVLWGSYLLLTKKL